ncbi:SDR family oxidoreductase [Aurantibacter sp.]|uniref:SDR family oxidoreductase n=1 Tax=Aurantibacter sp. TaxID=2807103 RepID=UPI0035C822E1
MNCLLTGATGIVGSHIMFEWLHKALTTKDVNHLYVVIRASKVSAKIRLKEILEDNDKPSFLNQFSTETLLDKITIIESDLLSLDINSCKNLNFNTIIHCAGSTNLLQSTDTKNNVKEQNLGVTKHLLNEFKTKLKRFIYISTAYSFGIQNKKVDDKISNHNVTSFRNPYEASKYESEYFVKEFCLKNNINSQVLRPSIVCGRLIEAPFFETPKFDVFYSWPMFLSKYAKKCTENFRIWIDKASGLNIVPVDFVAKSVLYAYLKPDLKELNIVNPVQILHKDYVGHVLRSFKINNFEYTSIKPENLNTFETLYYKSIGLLFEKYVSVPDLQFNAEAISKLIKQLGLEPNLGVHKNFMNLIDFSVEKKFRKSYS